MNKLIVLIVLLVLAVLGLGTFTQLKKKESAEDSKKIASVKASQGLLAATNEQVLAINAEGHIYGFGMNRQNELGYIGIQSVPIPKLVSDQRNWRYVHLGDNVSMAIDQYGKLWRRLYLRNEGVRTNELAEIGAQTFYMKVDEEHLFRKAMEQSGTAAALDEMQRLWVWRESLENFASHYAERLKESPPERVEVQPQQKWRDFCVSNQAFMAIDEAGAVWRMAGQDWANARKSYSSQPLDIKLTKINSNMPPAQHVYCSGYYNTVMLQDNNGELWGYGPNSHGELGMGDGSVDRRNSHAVTEISRLALGYFSEIAVAPGYTLAIHRDGSLWAWGLNTSGQLGIGKNISGSDKPRLVDNKHTWIAIAAGHDYAAGMTSEGELLTWGKNHQGTLGEGGSAPLRDKPLPVFDKQKWGGSVQ